MSLYTPPAQAVLPAGLLLPPMTNVTAAAGGGQAAGFPITTPIICVTTVGTAGDSLLLPVGQLGLQVIVANADPTDALSLYPQGGDTISALGMNAALSIPAGTVATLYCVATGPALWIADAGSIGGFTGPNLILPTGATLSGNWASGNQVIASIDTSGFVQLSTTGVQVNANGSIVPTVSSSINLGSSGRPWNMLYANQIIAPQHINTGLATSAPLTGTTITLSLNNSEYRVTGGAGIASLFIKLPASPQNGQTVHISTQIAITAFTLQDSTGSATPIITPPTALTAGQGFQAVWNTAAAQWWCSVG